MPRYLVEVSEKETIAVKRIDQSVHSIGSHFATHADWHRKDGVCTGTMVIEAADHRSGLGIVPPGMRAVACVFQLEAVAFKAATSGALVPPNGPYAFAA